MPLQELIGVIQGYTGFRVSQIQGNLSRVAYTKDSSIAGSIWGPPFLEKNTIQQMKETMSLTV